MKKALIIAGALCLGICIGLVGSSIFGNQIDTSWHPLLTKPKHFGISYDQGSVFSDLPTPDVNSVSGKAKFLNDETRQAVKLGYIVNVEVASLDLNKIPQRYKEKREIKINGHTATIEPIQQASYKVEFHFDLMDRDGFVLKTVHSKAMLSLETGKDNTFQAAEEDLIPYTTAMKVREILVRPAIVKCHTCLAPEPDTQTVGR